MPSSSVSETVDERKARTLRAWDALKVEIDGHARDLGHQPTDEEAADAPTGPHGHATGQGRVRGAQGRDGVGARPARGPDPVCHVVAHELVLKGDPFPHKASEHPGPAQNMDICSHTWADACRADAAAVACLDAHGISWKAKRAQKNAAPRHECAQARGRVATSGDNCALERRELLRLRDHVHRVTNRRVRVLLCPDGCWADALFRTEAMPAGQWLAWQHKSTAKMALTRKGQDLLAV